MMPWPASARRVVTRCRCRSGCSATRRRCCRNSQRRGVRPDVGDGPDLGARPGPRLPPAGWTVAEWEERQSERSEGGRASGPIVDGQPRPRRCSPGIVPGCRRSTMGTISGRWRRTRGSPTPSPSRVSCRRISVPLFCRGIGPVPVVCPVRRSARTSHKTDAKVKELLPDDKHLHHWLDMARKRIAFQGLPARICWVGLGDRHRLGLAFNEMVARGELAAPVVIGRDHLDSGSVASPNRETEAMADGSDAVSDWPLLNALLNCASGATWVSFHHGGGVGMGYSQHAGMVVVCDGTPAAAHGGSSGCCGTTRRPASCATPMPAIPRLLHAPGSTGWTFRSWKRRGGAIELASRVFHLRHPND